MIIYSQLPASDLQIIANVGDSLTVPFDFDINLTGYTITFTCTGVDTSMSNTLSTGLINVTFDTDVAAGSYPWELSWTTGSGSVRTVLSGTLRLT